METTDMEIMDMEEVDMDTAREDMVNRRSSPSRVWCTKCSIEQLCVRSLREHVCHPETVLYLADTEDTTQDSTAI